MSWENSLYSSLVFALPSIIPPYTALGPPTPPPRQAAVSSWSPQAGNTPPPLCSCPSCNLTPGGPVPLGNSLPRRLLSFNLSPATALWCLAAVLSDLPSVRGLLKAGSQPLSRPASHAVSFPGGPSPATAVVATHAEAVPARLPAQSLSGIQNRRPAGLWVRPPPPAPRLSSQWLTWYLGFSRSDPAFFFLLFPTQPRDPILPNSDRSIPALEPALCFPPS